MLNTTHVTIINNDTSMPISLVTSFTIHMTSEDLLVRAEWVSKGVSKGVSKEKKYKGIVHKIETNPIPLLDTSALSIYISITEKEED